MKKIYLLALAGLLLMFVPLPVQADEVAQYNFASAQGDKAINIIPGQEGSGAIYFYNIDGNRTTHITLAVSQSPTGWDVGVEPPLGERKLLVSDMPVTVEENLYVEPSELLAEEPAEVPEGMVSLKIPGRGYTLGKQARVVIGLPETVPFGTTETIVIAAEAFWLGQTGAAAVKQAREFEFTVTAVSGTTEYTEVVLDGSEEEIIPTLEPETPDSDVLAGALEPGSEELSADGSQAEPAQTGGDIEQSNHEETDSLPEDGVASSDNPLTKWLPVILAAIVVVLGAILIPRMVARKRNR